MAKKKTEEKAEIKLERVYNVPLRQGYMKVPKYKRAKKAVKTLREFLAKHMKSENVKIGDYVNKQIWQHGMRNPPHHVKVNAKKDDDGKVFAELVDAPVKKDSTPEAPKKEEKKAHRKKHAKKNGGSGGFSFFIFLISLLVIFIEGNFLVPYSSLSYTYFLFLYIAEI